MSSTCALDVSADRSGVHRGARVLGNTGMEAEHDSDHAGAAGVERERRVGMGHPRWGCAFARVRKWWQAQWGMGLRRETNKPNSPFHVAPAAGRLPLLAPFGDLLRAQGPPGGWFLGKLCRNIASDHRGRRGRVPDLLLLLPLLHHLLLPCNLFGQRISCAVASPKVQEQEKSEAPGEHGYFAANAHGESESWRAGEAGGPPLMAAAQAERPELTFSARSPLAFLRR